jgi:hypothetical protein
MPSHTFTVTDGQADQGRLPDWSTAYLLQITTLRQHGGLDQIARWLRVVRQGGYVGIDVFVFLVALFSWTRPDRRARAIKAFDSASSFCRRGLAAIAGRRQWPGQSAVSRFLSAVPAGEMLLEAGAHMLAYGTDALLRHPDAHYRDTLGQAWHVLDFDPTVIALRQRGLPEGEDLPPASRRVLPMATPGYTGRKRGEVQVSAGCLQHAGTGLWVQIMLESGNATVSTMLVQMLGKLGPWLKAAGATLERTLVRADGAAGNVPSVKAFHQHGVHYLARFACYGLLERHEVQAHLRKARWLAVADSGSGPRRQVTELGMWPWEDAPLLAEAPEGLGQARLLLSRFPAEKKHGAGVMLDGWQYELFGTSLHAAAWPAPEAVELYYGRASLENRFAQVKAELGIDRLFSTALGGQWLVMLVGLMVWNLRLILGAQRLGPLTTEAVSPQPRIEVVAAEPEPAPEPEPALEPEPELEPSLVQLPALLSQIVAELDHRDWSVWNTRHPGWGWHSGIGLKCPEGKVLAPLRLRMRADKESPTLRLRARQSDCVVCPQREVCFGGARPHRARRELHVGIAMLPTVKSGLYRTVVPGASPAAQRRRITQAQSPPKLVAVRQPWLPSALVQPGPWAVQAPRLIPSAFRQSSQAAVRNTAVRVEIHGDEAPNRSPGWRADAPDKRQRRRQTWAQRLARNALAAGAKVDAHVLAWDPWLRQALVA